MSASKSTTLRTITTGLARKDHKSKVKKPLSTADRIQRLFTSLCAQIDGGHFRNAVKTCDKILSLDSSDKDARQTKIFLLLQTEMYAEALTLLDTEGSEETYERAYTLYRFQRENEARDILEKIKKTREDDRGTVHLEAQLNYREGLYQEAFDLYNQLLDTAEPNSEEYSDILTNLRASQHHLDFINTGSRHAVAALPLSITSTLETSPPVQQTSVLTSATLSSVVGDHEIPKPATKKVRMRRVPAGVIPGVSPPPDPERWLKKSERSSFNHGKRKKGAGGGATQGAAVDSTPLQAQPSKPGGKGKKRK